MPGPVAARRHVGPAPPLSRPATFGTAPLEVVMGDPLTVPEIPGPLGYEATPEPDDLEPLWLKLPPELALFFDLGFCHSEPDCPTVVFKARDEGAGAIEISGPPDAFLGLAEIIAKLCRSVPCIAHAAPGEAAVAAAG